MPVGDRRQGLVPVWFVLRFRLTELHAERPDGSIGDRWCHLVELESQPVPVGDFQRWTGL